MTTTAPTGFTPLERELVQMTLHERFNRVVPIHDVEVTLQLDPTNPAAANCAALYWQQGDAEFVIAKVVRADGGPTSFRSQFFYGDDEAYGTGHSDYGNLGDCAIDLLQVQAGHAAERQAAPAGKTAPQPEITGDDYDGPAVI